MDILNKKTKSTYEEIEGLNELIIVFFKIIVRSFLLAAAPIYLLFYLGLKQNESLSEITQLSLPVLGVILTITLINIQYIKGIFLALKTLRALKRQSIDE